MKQSNEIFLLKKVERNEVEAESDYTTNGRVRAELVETVSSTSFGLLCNFKSIFYTLIIQLWPRRAINQHNRPRTKQRFESECLLNIQPITNQIASKPSINYVQESKE